MRQAILTKYIPPSANRGARIRAKAFAGEIIVPWSHEFNVEQNHERAANLLIEKMDWKDTAIVGGQLFDGNYVFTIKENEQ